MAIGGRDVLRESAEGFEELGQEASHLVRPRWPGEREGIVIHVKRSGAPKAYAVDSISATRWSALYSDLLLLLFLRTLIFVYPQRFPSMRLPWFPFCSSLLLLVASFLPAFFCFLGVYFMPR